MNLSIDVMDVDAAQYASISMEMLMRGDYLQVYHGGADYLDKPPLLFWLAALSVSVFGVSTFAYKLPVVIIIISSIYATYQFARLWYSHRHGTIAALITASTQAYFLITNDIRTDGLLTSFVILALWQLSRYILLRSWWGLMWGAVCVALAMMSKGPIVMIIVGAALGGHLLVRREWWRILDARWLVFLLVVGVLLLPMCYGLYQQFDLHPDKEVYGLKGPSGVKFFFWTQSFGRITGDIYWANDTSFFTFFHTILWDYQPWVVFLVPALLRFFYKGWRCIFTPSLLRSEKKPQEFMTLSGFVLSFVALSLSSYKLPHYIFPLFPLMAVMMADLVLSADGLVRYRTFFRFLFKFHFGLLHVFFVAMGVAFVFFFGMPSVWLLAYVLVSIVAYWLVYMKAKDTVTRVVYSTLVVGICVGLFFSTYFYPRLLQYQAPSRVGKYIQEVYPQRDFYLHVEHGHSLDFYSQRLVPSIHLDSLQSYPGGTLVYTNEQHVADITKRDSSFVIHSQYEHYPVTRLKLPFLMQSTRTEQLSTHVILEKKKR